MRRWIVSKRMLTCNNRRCEKDGIPGACRLVKLNEDGSYYKFCKTCQTGQDSHHKATSFKERRPCETPTCRHVRDVTVKLFALANEAEKEMYQKHCDACQLESSAARHLHQANVFQRRAAEIRRKRKKTFNAEAPAAQSH